MTKKIIKGKELQKELGVEERVRRGIFTPTVPPATGEEKGVLDRRVVEAREQASAIIEEANLVAEKIRKEAEEILDAAKKKFEEEKMRGYHEGREEGLASVTSHLAAFERVKDEFYRKIEGDILRLVMTISEKVIGTIVSEHAEAVRSIVKNAIDASLGDRILVRLNPEDYKVMVSEGYRYSDDFDRAKRIVFKEDESISRGGCIVETEIGTIDARLETQLEAIKKALEL